MTSIRQALEEASKSLETLPHGSPELESEVLLCHLLGKSRSHVFAWPDKTLTERQRRDYFGLINRRHAGEPIAHITGVREFWSLTLKVTPDTLIPRPETELLVERALEHLRTATNPVIADLGTGSGAIALALANERPDSLVHATDISAAALRIAEQNRQALGLNNVQYHQGNWLEALPSDAAFDLILSNPPYISTHDRHLQEGDLPREPAHALASGHDGLNDIRSIVSQTPQMLKPGGWLLLEHGYEQGRKVRDLLRLAEFGDIHTLRDLSGHERVAEGRRENIQDKTA